MTKRLWIITGASSLISEAFARLAAKQGDKLLLTARDKQQLECIASDISIRYQVDVAIMPLDMSVSVKPLLNFIQQTEDELSLFIGHSLIMDNAELDEASIEQMLCANVHHSVQLIHAYMKKNQQQHQILFLSSVAASRGRAKNSLYAGSKAAIERYLEGLQQAANEHTQITIMRLGYIDTQQTFGKAGIFYAAHPDEAAKACWRTLKKGRRKSYFPIFWLPIMSIIKALPMILFKKIN